MMWGYCQLVNHMWTKGSCVRYNLITGLNGRSLLLMALVTQSLTAAVMPGAEEVQNVAPCSLAVLSLRSFYPGRARHELHLSVIGFAQVVVCPRQTPMASTHLQAVVGCVNVVTKGEIRWRT